MSVLRRSCKKEEAIVCSHCRHDLAFFKPVEDRIRALEVGLSTIADELRDVSSRLTSARPIEIPVHETGFVGVIDKPSRVRCAVVVLLQILLTAGVVSFYAALQVSIRPSFQPSFVSDQSGTAEFADKIDAEKKLFERQYEEYAHRQRLITRIFLPVLFLIPIAVGLWMGIRWRGSHFKLYLLLGLASGLLEILIAGILLFATADLDLADLADGSFLIAVLINIARCAFGFVSGGLVGDRIEKRLYPERYKKGLIEQRAESTFDTRNGAHAQPSIPSTSLEIWVKNFGAALTAFGPILALIGTLAVAYIGYKGSTKAAEMNAKAAQIKASTPEASKEPSK